MKIGSIILAIVVSLVVWAISFKSLLPYEGPILSIVVALAGGIIAVLLFLFLKKPAIIQIIFAAFGALVFMFVASMVSSRRACNGPRIVTVFCEVAEKRITLTDNEAVSDDDIICARRNGKIKWLIDRRNIPGTGVKVDDFKKGGLPAQPLNSKKYEGDKTNPLPEASVKYKDGVDHTTVEGEYKYSVTCTQGGASHILDPIIKVPH